MNQTELIELRERILRDITPLVLETAEVGGERFSLLLRIIQAGSADSKVYESAYENAKAIEDKSNQLRALMDLLDEVDFDAQVNETDALQQQAPEGEGEIPTPQHLAEGASQNLQG